MSKYCDDCGTRFHDNNVCSQCFEEMYINDYQMADLDVEHKLGKEWANKVEDQRIEHKEKYKSGC